MPKTSKKHSKKEKKEYERVNFGEFFNISKWVLKLNYKIAPKETVVFIITTIVKEFGRIANTYIVALILDKAVEIAQFDSATVYDLLPYFGVLIGFNILTTINSYFRLISRRISNLLSWYRLKQELYWKYHDLGVQTLENPDVNNKLFRANRALNDFPRFFQNLVDFIGSVAGLLTVSIIILKFAPIVVPIVIISVLPQLIHDQKYRKIVWGFDYKHTEKNRKAWASAGDLTVTSKLHEIFINGSHKFLHEKFDTWMQWYQGERVEQRRKWFKGMYGYSLFGNIGIYVGYLFAFAKFIAGSVTVGTVFFQIRMIDRLSREFDHAFSIFNTLFEMALRLKDTYALFILEPEVEDGSIELERFSQGPDILLDNVTFSYPRSENPVLAGLNLHIKSGEKVAVVGHNGAGKTTLVKLLSRMYQTDEGAIKVNGENINDVAINSLYKNMGVLFQDFATYPQLTVRENVIIGRPREKVDEKRFVEALARADALDFVNDYKHKFDQILNEKYEGGIRPSTGQWQKLAIARFFYRNAPLVIFDEPTAAIDAVSEYNIFNKIYSFFEGKTVIIISHRFSTVRNADRIIVIEKGRIIEEGSHDELMKKDGYYAKSFRLQAEGYTSTSSIV